jgi:3-hydroxyisobutyrate dehydrogenase-like beta-hydroxyacid dehydrogenase
VSTPETTAPRLRVGFVGLGIMGSRMAANLAGAGHELVVATRTPGKAEAWAAEHGAEAVATPAELAARSDIVVTMVVDGAQVRDALLGASGVARGGHDDLLCVDMSTIAPADARRIGEALAERGLRFVDAPVTGSSPRAEDGTLTIMAGGAEEDVRRAWPLFEVMGRLVLHVGPLGQGQTVKLLNNAVAAANANTLAQALVAGAACGVDLDALVQVMAAGSGGSAMLDLKAGPMRAHDWTTLFKLEHMLKDVRLCLETTQAAGVPFPAAAEAREMLTAGVARGLGDRDFAALLEAVEGLAGRRI